MGLQNLNEKALSRSAEESLSLWLNLIHSSDSASDLKKRLEHMYSVIQYPEVHNPFFERIHYLKNNTSSHIELEFLEFIREQIETIVQQEYSDEAPDWLRRSLINGGRDELQ